MINRGVRSTNWSLYRLPSAALDSDITVGMINGIGNFLILPVSLKHLDSLCLTVRDNVWLVSTNSLLLPLFVDIIVVSSNENGPYDKKQSRQSSSDKDEDAAVEDDMHLLRTGESGR
jgi:hypothetical protein